MIFISYSSRDYDTARTIKKVLESNGIECWMAPEIACWEAGKKI